jgi:LysR family transcriptional regulator, transcriptional activator for dmlA
MRSREGRLDAISDFALFRAIVDAGGISAAALVLQSSPAAVSRRLTALEAKLGVRLADRSSRRFRLTDEGLLLYERSRSILEQIRDVEAEVASRGGAARGLLRVGAPSDFGRRHVAPILAAFTSEHVGLEAHLVLSDAGLENQADGCDLVLRFGLPNDPAMIARKIAVTTRILCAAPSYLARHGTPQSPDDLLQHNCLRLARRHHLDDLWHFRRDAGEFEIRVKGKLSSGDGAVLHEWALSGEGISWEALWDVSTDLASGRLVHLMPEYQSWPMELYAIFAPGKPVPPRIRVFVDHVARAFAHFEPNASANAPGAVRDPMAVEPN